VSSRDGDLVEVDLMSRELLVGGVYFPEGYSLIGVSSGELIAGDEVDRGFIVIVPCGGSGGGISSRVGSPASRWFSLPTPMSSITAFIAARLKPARRGS